MENAQISRLFFVFDVESIGFHGEAYAVGFCVVDEGGQEQGYGRYACNPASAAGDMAGHKWVAENATFPATVNCRTIQEVRDHFISAYNGWRSRGVIFAADCPFPVEARFLLECFRDFPEQVALPYPLIDVASVVLAAGGDPIGTFPRLGEGELPLHDPLADARQSARILVESLAKCRGGK